LFFILERFDERRKALPPDAIFLLGERIGEECVGHKKYRDGKRPPLAAGGR